MRLKEEIVKKRPLMKKKVLFHQNNAPCRESIATIAKIHELHPELLLNYSPDLVSSEYWLFSELKRMNQGKTFVSNEDVTLETEAYFETKDKSFYEKGIGLLEKRWNQYIPQERDYVDE